MSRLGVDREIAELAIGHKRTGLDGLYNFDEAWQLRCDAFAKVSDYFAAMLRGASAERKIVAPSRGGPNSRSVAQSENEQRLFWFWRIVSGGRKSTGHP